MGLFDWLTGGNNSYTDAQRERDEWSQRSIEAGGLPANAVDRLREEASRQGTPQHFWTSDLSVSEFLLTREAQFVPLGQVMGSSVYHVGWQWRTQNWRNASWRGGGASYELDILTQAFYNARHLALGRLQQEAQLLGATGVVGVRLEHKEYEWGMGLLEFSAIGTAIREHHLPPLPEGAPPRPIWLSELSGEEFWTLREGGFRPCGVAVGNCTYYQIPSWNTQNLTQGGWFGTGSWQNVELPDYTQSLYTARSLAMGRMEAEAQAAGATGIVSVSVDLKAEPIEIEVSNQTRIDMMYHFTAIGTAIQPFSYEKPKLSIGLPIELSSSRRRTTDHLPLQGSAESH